MPRLPDSVALGEGTFTRRPMPQRRHPAIEFVPSGNPEVLDRLRAQALELWAERGAFGAKDAAVAERARLAADAEWAQQSENRRRRDEAEVTKLQAAQRWLDDAPRREAEQAMRAKVEAENAQKFRDAEQRALAAEQKLAEQARQPGAPSADSPARPARRAPPGYEARLRFDAAGVPRGADLIPKVEAGRKTPPAYDVKFRLDAADRLVGWDINPVAAPASSPTATESAAPAVQETGAAPSGDSDVVVSS